MQFFALGVIWRLNADLPADYLTILSRNIRFGYDLGFFFGSV